MNKSTIYACAVVAGALAACASGPAETGLSQQRIYDACLRVEVPKAMEKFRAEGKSTEDAPIFAHYICKVISGACAKDPQSGKCPQNLKDYGLTN